MPLSIWPRGDNSWWRVTSGTRPEHQVGSTLSPTIIFISIKWTPNWSFPSLSSPLFLLTLPSSNLPPFLVCFVYFLMWTFSFFWKRTLAGQSVYKNGSIDTSFDPPLVLIRTFSFVDLFYYLYGLFSSLTFSFLFPIWAFLCWPFLSYSLYRYEPFFLLTLSFLLPMWTLSFLFPM